MAVPNWLYPKDVATIKYLGHLVIIAVIVLGLLTLFKFGNMFTLKNIVISTLLIGFADITSHSILKTN